MGSMPLWENQTEALEFALRHPVCMLDMDMGTGKTRVAIETVFARRDVYRVLIICPKAVVPVWRQSLQKFASDKNWSCWDELKGSVQVKTNSLSNWVKNKMNISQKQFIVMNYDIVWRKPMGDFIRQLNPNMVILDESHRAKAAGSKVSKYLGLLGKQIKYKMCLSGTPMANSPLDVYGQYRFLDNRIFGTNYSNFLSEYAIMSYTTPPFPIGYKNQKSLQEKFDSIAYSCKMSDIEDQLKLPSSMPPIERKVVLPPKDIATSKNLAKEFITECGDGFVVVSNVLVKLVRLQQITSGFCEVVDDLFHQSKIKDINTSKGDSLFDLLQDIPSDAPVVVFCTFKHDIDTIRAVVKKSKREAFELSGRINELRGWQKRGGVLITQIQAGAEGIDMTKSHYAIYYSLPHSLALYEQSKARLYRPGQKYPVSFIHLIAENTIDEVLYSALLRKKDIINSIKSGDFDFGYLK